MAGDQPAARGVAGTAACPRPRDPRVSGCGCRALCGVPSATILSAGKLAGEDIARAAPLVVKSKAVTEGHPRRSSIVPGMAKSAQQELIENKASIQCSGRPLMMQHV